MRQIQIVSCYRSKLSHATDPNCLMRQIQIVPYNRSKLSHATDPNCLMRQIQIVPYDRSKLSHATDPNCLMRQIQIILKLTQVTRLLTKTVAATRVLFSGVTAAVRLTILPLSFVPVWPDMKSEHHLVTIWRLATSPRKRRLCNDESQLRKKTMPSMQKRIAVRTSSMDKYSRRVAMLNKQQTSSVMFEVLPNDTALPTNTTTNSIQQNRSL